jgi:hypothetical protein
MAWIIAYNLPEAHVGDCCALGLRIGRIVLESVW